MSTVKLVLLVTLSDTAKYGYQILKELESISADFFAMREGTLYPILHRLEKVGHVKSEWKISKSGRDRRYYKLTPKGRASMLAQKERWGKMVKAVDNVLAGVKP